MSEVVSKEYPDKNINMCQSVLYLDIINQSEVYKIINQ